MKSKLEITLWVALTLGIVLRAVNVLDAPVTTDEAQFLLGVPHSQPPLIFWLLTGVQWLFGPDLMMTRAVTVLVGISSLALVYLLWKELFGEEHALLAAVIAALVPGHIAFSRVVYLDVYLVFAWLGLAYVYVRTLQNEKDGLSILFLFVTALLATFIKSQGFMFIGLLLLHRFWVKRRVVFSDPIVQVLILALIPIACYFVAHPKILATSFANIEREAFGLSLGRLLDIATMLWEQNRLFTLLMLAGVPFLKRAGWLINSLCLLALVLPFLFGAGHIYYSAYTIAFAFLGVFALIQMKERVREGALLLLGLNAFLILGPRQLWESPWQHEWFRERAYWNDNADKVNAVLAGADEITVVTPVGHEARWYLEPKIRVLAPDALTNVTGYIVQMTNLSQPVTLTGSIVVHEDEHVRVLFIAADETGQAE